MFYLNKIKTGINPGFYSCYFISLLEIYLLFTHQVPHVHLISYHPFVVFASRISTLSQFLSNPFLALFTHGHFLTLRYFATLTFLMSTFDCRLASKNTICEAVLHLSCLFSFLRNFVRI